MMATEEIKLITQILNRAAKLDAGDLEYVRQKIVALIDDKESRGEALS